MRSWGQRSRGHTNTYLTLVLFQDDILKLSVSVVGAQNGLNRVQKALDLKLLDVHPDKTGHVIIADDENRNQIEEELNKTPLKYKVG